MRGCSLETGSVWVVVGLGECGQGLFVQSEGSKKSGELRKKPVKEEFVVLGGMHRGGGSTDE